MTMRVLRRIVETLFRRLPLYLAIVVAAVMLGALSTTRNDATYTSSATIFVDSNSLVTSQSGVQTSGTFTFLSPARFTSQELAGLLQTDVFLAAVAERTGLDLVEGPGLRVDEDGNPISPDELDVVSGIEPAPDPVAWAEQAAELRSSMGLNVISENLVSISVSTADPELSYRLAGATIDEFVQFQITIDVAESAASEVFFTDLAAVYQQEVIEAQEEVDATIARLEEERAQAATVGSTVVEGQSGGSRSPTAEELTVAQELELDRAKEAEVIAANRFRLVTEDVEVAELAMLQAETDVRQTYSVFDPPQLAGQPDSSLIARLMVLAVAALVGVGLALVVPLLMGYFGRVVLFADDVEEYAPVIAIIPALKRRSIRASTQKEAASAAALTPEELERQAVETTSFQISEANGKPELIPVPAPPAPTHRQGGAETDNGTNVDAPSTAPESDVQTADQPTPIEEAAGRTAEHASHGGTPTGEPDQGRADPENSPAPAPVPPGSSADERESAAAGPVPPAAPTGPPRLDEFPMAPPLAPARAGDRPEDNEPDGPGFLIEPPKRKAPAAPPAETPAFDPTRTVDMGPPANPVPQRRPAPNGNGNGNGQRRADESEETSRNA